MADINFMDIFFGAGNTLSHLDKDTIQKKDVSAMFSHLLLLQLSVEIIRFVITILYRGDELAERINKLIINYLHGLMSSFINYPCGIFSFCRMKISIG